MEGEERGFDQMKGCGGLERRKELREILGKKPDRSLAE